MQIALPEKSEENCLRIILSQNRKTKAEVNNCSENIKSPNNQYSTQLEKKKKQ